MIEHYAKRDGTSKAKFYRCTPGCILLRVNAPFQRLYFPDGTAQIVMAYNRHHNRINIFPRALPCIPTLQFTAFKGGGGQICANGLLRDNPIIEPVDGRFYFDIEDGDVVGNQIITINLNRFVDEKLG